MSTLIREYNLNPNNYPIYYEKASISEVDRCLDKFLRYATNHEDHIPFHRIEDRCFNQSRMLKHLVLRLIDLGKAEALKPHRTRVNIYRTEYFVKAAGLWLRNGMFYM